MGIAAPTYAAETTLELVAGYDDNVDERAGGTGSGFLDVRGFLNAALFSDAFETLTLDLFADGRYAHRLRVDDLGEAGVGISARYPLSGGRWIPGASLEGRILRDDFLPGDDRGSLFLRGELRFLATASATLGLVQEFGRDDYREAVEIGAEGGTNRPPFSRSGTLRAGGPPADRPGAGPADGSGNPGVRDVDDREDDIAATRLRAEFFPRPALRFDVEGVWTRLDSSIERESFDGIGLSAGAGWFPEPWGFRLSFAGYRDDYDAELSGGGSREDTTWILGAELRRSFGPVDGLAAVEWTGADSSADNQSYRRTVTRCGVSWSF